MPIGHMPSKGAERLEVQFEDMSIAISIKELAAWGRSKGSYSSELSSWLNLLEVESRAGLVKLLQAPLLKDRSMARQMLRSWVGIQLLDEISDLVRLDEDSSGNLVINTLESLLENQSQVTTLDLLEALPAKSIRLDLDALLELASRWRIELQNQQQLLLALSRLPSKRIDEQFKESESSQEKLEEPSYQRKVLRVEHRREHLDLELWSPSPFAGIKENWIVLMPGLGGSQEHFRWLARSLSRDGWIVLLLEHPGSDAQAVQALLNGLRPVPGAEVLPDRLADLRAVLTARERGTLAIPQKRVVLIGHSLGALTALLASGAVPEQGLAKRCEKALDDLSLTNLSKLLQCQLVDVQLPEQKTIPQIDAVVAINSFGSLLWPTRDNGDIPFPVLLTGGTFDLITPPMSEQLELLLAITSNSKSRTLLIEGASHFSPVRVEGQVAQEKGDDLFQLGESIVGVQPLVVQGLLAFEIRNFLEKLNSTEDLGTSVHKQKGDFRLHIFNRNAVKKLLRN